MSNKPYVGNPIQKGNRRRKIHDHQDNVGDPQNKPEHKNFDGKEIK